METKTVPVIPDGLLEKFGVSKKEFIETFKACANEMRLLRRKVSSRDSYEKGVEWCIIMNVKKESPDNDIDLYLYLTKAESSAVFGQVSLCWDNVPFFDKKSCLQTVEYIKTVRASRSPNAIGDIKAYNPYTGETV